MGQPLISIITPCLNREDFIREAVESVLSQNYPNFEHLIMDACSTDRTLEILRTYPHLHVVSEPDQGMYDAINKGIRRSQGKIIGLLNTDDILADGCFEAITTAFDRHHEALAVVGGVTVFCDDPSGRRTISSTPTIGPDEFWYRLIQGHPVSNAWFYRREVFERFGYFDASYRYVSDRFYLIHLAVDGGVRPVAVPQALYHYRQHPGSGTMTDEDSRSKPYGFMRMTLLKEDIRAREEYLDRPDLPGEVRRRMRREHGERCYRLAATALYHRQGRLVLDAVRRGWGRNVLWPFIFIEMAARRLWKEVSGNA
jgi:glycosyltransferase involved in cell wall biosynthesis